MLIRQLDIIYIYCGCQYCWVNGGYYLAEFFSSEEEEAIDAILNRDIAYWFGLSDLAHEGTWRWQESHQLPEYSNWLSGQPNGDGDCGYKTFRYDGEWADADCSVNSIGHCTDYDHGHAHALCQREK